ncbi:MAG: hypothetical protein JWN78_1511 [Bacteroidota bacterium]|nr:hypothetical protein [Bacteroidota bacterium]
MSHAQNACDHKTSPHLRLIGDSWMQFPVIYQAYDSALAKYGFADYYSLGDGTAVIGATGESWWQEPFERDALESALTLDHDKPIDIVMISLGGNGVAFEGSHNDPPSVLYPYLYRNKLFMDTLFDFIHLKLPNAQIIWQGYDYPNFLDPIIDYPWNPYRDIWDSHGQMPPWEVNSMLIYMTNFTDSVVQAYNKPYIHYFNCLGLMQWIYGQPTPLRGWPGGTYPPRSVPLPGGDPRYPSPQAAMGLNGLDTYHLGPKSFTELAEFYMRKYISNYLRKERDSTVHSQGADKDGWVTSGNQTGTGEIQLGKNSTTVTKGIISFNTDFIPADKKIKRASLFIRNKTINKKFPLSNVFPNFFKLDIVKGTFGNDAVEASDFSAPASAYDIACVAGNLRGNEYTLRFDLHEDALQYINKTGTTQFRIEITDENFIRFYNGDTAELEGPYLDLYYDTTSVTTGIITQKNMDQNLQLFPNPAKNEIAIQLSKEWRSKKSVVAIYNTLGALVSTSTFDKSTTGEIKLDISKLAAGDYVISLENGETKSAGTFVKLHE